MNRPPKAEAHHAAYRAALELRSWDEALAELRQAVAADARFAVWPATKYQVERILGAGAFGVAFLCHHRYKDRHVVIKTFEAAGIDRDVATLFREAQILDRLEHPGIVRLLDCGFADEARQQRPYLEIAHFADSLTLEDHVHQHGPLTCDDLLPVAVQTAEALQAAHEAGVLHRDVKPGNLLVRRTARGWEVKVIDFGLSLRRSLIQASQARAASLNRSMIGSAVAGTLHYAAPEQLDPDRSERSVRTPTSSASDGRAISPCFGEPDPDQEDLDTLPQALEGRPGPMHGEEDRATTEGLRRRAGAARGHPGAAREGQLASANRSRVIRSGRHVDRTEGNRHQRPRRRRKPPLRRSSSTPWA